MVFIRYKGETTSIIKYRHENNDKKVLLLKAKRITNFLYL